MPADDFCVIRVRLTPRALRDEIAGWREGVLVVKVKAPPLEGRANEALREVLARRLGVPAGRIKIASGLSGRIKTLRIEGLSERQVRERTEEIEN